MLSILYYVSLLFLVKTYCREDGCASVIRRLRRLTAIWADMHQETVIIIISWCTALLELHVTVTLSGLLHSFHFDSGVRVELMTLSFWSNGKKNAVEWIGMASEHFDTGHN